jgi:hypothetical protein
MSADLRAEQQFTLSFGALAQPVEDQLRGQGLRLNMTPLNRNLLQRDIDEVSRLLFREVITRAQASSARSRIFKRIQRHVKPLEDDALQPGEE